MKILYFVISIFFLIAHTQREEKKYHEEEGTITESSLLPNSTINSIGIFQQYELNDQYSDQEVLTSISSQEVVIRANDETTQSCENNTTYQTEINKAVEFQQKGEYQKSLAIYKKELEHCIRIRGNSDNVEVGKIYSMMSGLYNHMGEYDHALAYQELTLEIQKRHLPDSQRFLLARSYSNMGSIYQDMDNLEVSFQYYRQAINILEEEVSSNHTCPYSIDMLAIYNNVAHLASILSYKRGKKDDQLKARLIGISYYSKSLGISKQRQEFLNIANAYVGLTHLYNGARDVKNIRKYFCKAVQAFKQYLIDHPGDPTAIKRLTDFQDYYKALVKPSMCKNIFYNIKS